MISRSLSILSMDSARVKVQPTQAVPTDSAADKNVAAEHVDGSHGRPNARRETYDHPPSSNGFSAGAPHTGSQGRAISVSAAAVGIQAPSPLTSPAPSDRQLQAHVFVPMQETPRSMRLPAGSGITTRDTDIPPSVCVTTASDPFRSIASRVSASWLRWMQDCIVFVFLILIIAGSQVPDVPDCVKHVLHYPHQSGWCYFLTLAIGVGVTSITAVTAALRLFRGEWGHAKFNNSLYIMWRTVLVSMIVGTVYNAVLLSQASLPLAWAPQSGTHYFDEQTLMQGGYSDVRLVWPTRKLAWAVIGSHSLGCVGLAFGLSYPLIIAGELSAIFASLCLFFADMTPLGSSTNVICLVLSAISGIGAVQVFKKVVTLAWSRANNARNIARWQIVFVAALYAAFMVSFVVVYYLSRFGVLDVSTELIIWPMLETVAHAIAQVTCASIGEAYAAQKAALDREAGAAMLSKANIQNNYPVNDETTIADVVQCVAAYLKPIAAFQNIQVKIQEDISADQLVSMQPLWFETVLTTLMSLSLEVSQPGDVITVTLSRYGALPHMGALQYWIQTSVSCNAQALHVRKIGVSALVLPPGMEGPAVKKARAKNADGSLAGSFLFSLPQEEGAGFQEGFSLAADLSIAARLDWASHLMVRSGGSLGIRNTPKGSAFVVDLPAVDVFNSLQEEVVAAEEAGSFCTVGPFESSGL